MTASYHPPVAFPPQNSEERAALLGWIETSPLVYGPWQDFKQGFKTMESAYLNGTRDVQTLGGVLSRVDAQPFPEHRKAATGTRQPLLPLGVHSLLAIGDVIYATTSMGFRIFDASSPLVPVALPAQKTTQISNPIRVGQYLVSNNGSVHSVENPREPKFVVRGSFNGYEFCALDDQHFISSNQWQGLYIYRLSPADKTFAAVGQLEGGFTNVRVAGRRAVASYTRPGDYRNTRMRLLDLSNPASPRLGAEVGERDEWPLALRGDILITQKNSQFRTYDLNLTPPRLLGKLDISNLRSLQIHGDLGVAYVYNYDWRNGTTQNLVFIDLSQPHDPRKVGEVPVQSQPSSVRVGDILWLGLYDGLHVLDITNPSRAQFIGQKPSASTFGYLKRRGRRLLRVLAESDEAAYVELAAEILRRGSTSGLDFGTQWMEADILVGAGNIWKQARHGRGPVKRTPHFWRSQRLERASAAWDKNLALARELAGNEALAWQTRVTMRRVLAANGEQAAKLSPAALEAVLWGDWPFAAVEAAREAEQRLGELSHRAVAALLWNVNPRRRRAVLEQVSPGGSVIYAAVGTQLATLLGRDVQWREEAAQGSLPQRQTLQIGLTRRGREIALLLAARCDLSDLKFDASGALPALPALLSSSEAPLRSLGLDLCRRVKPEQALELVALLPRITPANREAFIEALCVSASRGKFGEEHNLSERVRHTDAEVRSAVWRLLAASKTSASVIRPLWTGILRGLFFEYDYNTRVYQWRLSSFLESALNTPAALNLLARHGANADEIMRFGPRFWGQPAAPGTVFTAYSLFIPAGDLIRAVAEVSNEVWAGWRAPWLRAISAQPKLLAAFWQAVQAALDDPKFSEADKLRLRGRTFHDPEVAATFAGAAGNLPPALLLQLIGAVTDSVWNLWRDSLLKSLQDDAATRAAFWNAARTIGLDNELLRARLVDDAEIAATFGLLEGDALDFDDPALEQLVLNWLDARRDTLGSDDLSRAGTHPLPEVRAWGLGLLDERGLNIPLALRLLESDLRDAILAARQWFERADADYAAQELAGTGKRIDLVMALCDSPHLDTRVYGREFLAERLEFLPMAQLTARLQENPNAEMQSYVAELLLAKQTAAEGMNATEFDRAVLRGRYRARKAKSLVQERRTKAETLPDERTLLELARGRTPRDADWAFTQLAKRALENPVDGVDVSGIGAI